MPVNVIDRELRIIKIIDEYWCRRRKIECRTTINHQDLHQALKWTTFYFVSDSSVIYKTFEIRRNKVFYALVFSTGCEKLDDVCVCLKDMRATLFLHPTRILMFSHQCALQKHPDPAKNTEAGPLTNQTRVPNQIRRYQVCLWLECLDELKHNGGVCVWRALPALSPVMGLCTSMHLHRSQRWGGGETIDRKTI